MFSPTNSVTSATSVSSRSRSTLLMTTTIFLPQSRIDSMNARSLSVNGRSAEVTKRTMSERGTNCWVSCSCSRMMALVPGVSTMVISSRNSAGYSRTMTPSACMVTAGIGSVAQQVDDRGRRRHALRHHLRPDEGVDEGGLAGVELADDHQQEERDQVLRRPFDGTLVLLGRRVAREGLREPVKQRQLVLDQLLFLPREQRPGNRPLTVAAGASRQLKHTSTHLAPIVLRAPSCISRLSGSEVSRSMEDWRRSDKRSLLTSG